MRRRCGGQSFFRHIDQLEIAPEGTHHQLHLAAASVDHRHTGAALLVFLLVQFAKTRRRVSTARSVFTANCSSTWPARCPAA